MTSAKITTIFKRSKYSSSRLRNVTDYEDPNLPGCYLLREVNEFEDDCIDEFLVSTAPRELETAWLET